MYIAITGQKAFLIMSFFALFNGVLLYKIDNLFDDVYMSFA